MFSYIWIIIGVVILGLYNGLLLLDDKTPENSESGNKIEKKWHFVGAILFSYLCITFAMLWGPLKIPFALSMFWLLYGGIVHKIGLKKSFFYVGVTAKTDIFLRKIFKKKPEFGSAILKILIVILSLILAVLYE